MSTKKIQIIGGLGQQTDAIPTEGSTNPVQSGGVYDAIAAQGAALSDLIETIEIPTKVNELENDAGYITINDVSNQITEHDKNISVHYALKSTVPNKITISEIDEIFNHE